MISNFMNYKKIISLTFILSITATFFTTRAQEINEIPSKPAIIYNDSLIVHPKRPWKAALETFGLNVGIWGFDRYVLQGDFAHINSKTIKNNFETGFVWDNDQFSTNLFAHPYTGGLYFNTARNSGLNFYQSIPYSVGGSLMWEFFMENEPPAINDFISTSIGGISLGEVTYRLSDLIIDSRSTGWERVGREFLSTVISPMTGLNRLISGDMWKRRNFRGRSVANSVPLECIVRLSYRALAENNDISESISNSMYVDASLIYGDPFDRENQKPYDYFSLKAGFNLISDRQPLISNINAIGMIWGKDIEMKKPTRNLTLGIFQHFDYYDSYGGNFMGEGGVEKVDYHYFRIAEAAAFGGGMIYRANMSEKNYFLLSAHINGVLLGATSTDYYNDIDRDYNLGSGYSTKLKTGFVFNSKFEMGLNFEHYQIFTWKGYPQDIDWSSMTHEEGLYVNAQGDKGNSRLSIVGLSGIYKFNEHLSIYASISDYIRKSYYSTPPVNKPSNVRYAVTEGKIGIGYVF